MIIYWATLEKSAIDPATIPDYIATDYFGLSLYPPAAKKVPGLGPHGEFIVPGPAQIGTSSANFFRVGPDGVVSLLGTARRRLTLRPELNVDEVKKQTVPEQVEVGVFFAYSLPVWSADSHEELFFKQSIPARWDGATNITIHVLVALSAAEDVDDYFKFQLSWNNVADESDVIPATTHDVTAEQIVLTGRSAQYNVYELVFTIDWAADGEGNEVQAHDLLACRLRRVDATNPDVTGEIYVLDWHTHFIVDKMFMAL